MESFSIIESFTDLEDAVYFFQSHLRERARENWEVQQGSGIQYVNHQWRVGLSVSRDRVKPVVEPEQYELPYVDQDNWYENDPVNDGA